MGPNDLFFFFFFWLFHVAERLIQKDRSTGEGRKKSPSFWPQFGALGSPGGYKGAS